MTWLEDAQGWTANGFVIRSIGPSRWAVWRKRQPEPGPVRVVHEPLTVERTLSAAKREAELMAAAEQLGEQRRRWAMNAMASSAAVWLALGLPEPWNVLVTLALVVLALRLLANIVSSWFDGVGASPEDMFYQ